MLAPQKREIQSDAYVWWTMHIIIGPIARQMLGRAVGGKPGTLTTEVDDYLGRISANVAAESSVDKLAEELIRDMPHEVTLIRRGGYDQIVGKLVGEGMRRSGKRTDPRLLRTVLERLLGLTSLPGSPKG